MAIKEPERHTRDQTIFYMEESIKKLSPNAAIAIVRNDSFNSFLLFLVDHEPKKMASIMRTALEKAAFAVKTLKVKREQERNEVKQKNEMKEKRKAAEEESEGCDGEEEAQAEGGRKTKKAKLGSKTRACNAALDSPPPPYSARSLADSSDIESDDGVELAVEETTGQAKKKVLNSDAKHELEKSLVQDKQQQQEAENAAETDEDDEDNQSASAEMDIHEAPNSTVDDDQLRANHRQTDTSEDGGQNTHRVKILSGKETEREDRQAHELRNEEFQANAQIEQSGDQTRSSQTDEQSIHATDHSRDKGQSIDQMESSISKAELDYAIEIGLTRGDPKILSKLQEQFPVLRNPEAAPVFELCQKLDFDPAHSALLRFLRNRLAEMKDPQKLVRMQSPCEFKTPDKIYDDIQTAKATTAEAKIFRAYWQISLFDSVNADADKQVMTDKNGKRIETHIWHLETLATRKAGNAPEKERKAIKKSYKAEYLAGEKWTRVVKWFGGKGVIMAFILAGIPPYLIARKFKKSQRLALKELAPYLKSIRKMVKILGPNPLEDYCRPGRPSKENFSEIESLQACLPEEVVDSGIEEEREEDAEGYLSSNESDSED